MDYIRKVVNKMSDDWVRRDIENTQRHIDEMRESIRRSEEVLERSRALRERDKNESWWK
jgi:hypothetical protein